SAWIFQKAEDVTKLGAEQAPYYVGFYEPDGTRRKKACGAGRQGKRIAEKLRRKIEAELMTGTYQMHAKKLWPDFRREYESRILAGLAVRSRDEARIALNHFERIVKPVRIFALCTAHVDKFIAARRQERGKKKGDPISPATINKDLRHVKAALRVAVEGADVKQLPEFRVEKDARSLPDCVHGDAFALSYHAC